MKRGAALTYHHCLKLLSEHDDMALTAFNAVITVIKSILAPYAPVSLVIATQGQALHMDSLVKQLKVLPSRLR